MPLFKITPDWGGQKYLIAKDVKEAVDIWERVSKAHTRELASVEKVCSEDDIMHDPRDNGTRT